MKIKFWKKDPNEKWSPNPHRDWRRFFLIFAITSLVLLVGGALFLRLSILRAGGGGETASSTIKLDRATLERVSQIVEEREEQFEALTATTTLLVDPS